MTGFYMECNTELKWVTTVIFIQLVQLIPKFVMLVIPISRRKIPFFPLLKNLTHFSPMFNFYTSWKRQKSKGLLKSSGRMEIEHLGYLGYKLILVKLWKMKTNISKVFCSKTCLVLMQSIKERQIYSK